MMREVVDDGDTIDDRANFEAPLDAVKAGQRLTDCRDGHTVAEGKRSGCGGIQSIVFTGQRHLELSPHRAVMVDFPEALAIVVAQFFDAPVGICSEAVPLDATER